MPFHALPSYRPTPEGGCCQGSPERPCWGRVTLWSDFADEFCEYTCEGHTWWWHDGDFHYDPSAEIMDIGATPILLPCPWDEVPHG